MKKILGSLLAVILLFTSLVMLTGCGNSDEDSKKEEKTNLADYAGTYQGQYTKLVGDSEKNEDDIFYLELNEDGTGTHYRDDYSFSITWSLKGEKFTMTETFLGAEIEYKGTLKDGELDIFNGDEDDIWTYEYVYEKE